MAVTNKARVLREAGEPVIGFGAGEPDFPTPDHKHWGKINSVITKQQDGSMSIDYTTYPPISSELKGLLDANDLHEEEE